MNNSYEHRRPTELENIAHAEALQHFSEHLKQFPASREAVDRLERDLAKIGLAANIAASKPTPTGNFLQADDGAQWHKSVELMENIFLCHRPVMGGTEYAVVEHFLARGTNETWNRGGNAVEVLRIFAQEQRQALQVWTEDMSAQVKEFLAEKFPGQDMGRVTESLMHRLNRPVSQKQSQAHEQNRSHGVRI